MPLPLWLLVSVASAFLVLYSLVPSFIRLIGITFGRFLRHQALSRRDIHVARAKAEKTRQDETRTNTTLDDEWEKIDRSRSRSRASRDAEKDKDSTEWDGVIGFFHPFCNAGGGGERVLWAAIRATQDKYPNALCAVYTGDHEVSKEGILRRVRDNFDIHLNPPMVTFLYLTTRHYVLSSTWPHFTLLGQSLGSLILAHDAFSLLVPDIFIDTMGYAFAVALCKYLFPDVPTAAYVHYPTISTDMLDSLDADTASGRGVNAGAGKGLKGLLKRNYWHLFAWLYGWVGGSIDVVMTNSSWTLDHIQQLWSSSRERRGRHLKVEVVFPPVAVEALAESIEISRVGENSRKPELLYIAQFRPEKNHQLVLQSFAKFLRSDYPLIMSPTDNTPSPLKDKDFARAPSDNTNTDTSRTTPQLILIGSVRNTTDETYIYSLRLLAHELRITPHVTFLLNAPWSSVLAHLRTASVGINAMWNEHFGIGVVEYLAAGLISVVHDSGGPKRDIVVDVENGEGEGGSGPTGIRATDVLGFAQGYNTVLCSMSDDERWRTRLRARSQAQKFSEENFDERWLKQMDRLVKMRIENEG